MLFLHRCYRVLLVVSLLLSTLSVPSLSAISKRVLLFEELGAANGPARAGRMLPLVGSAVERPTQPKAGAADADTVVVTDTGFTPDVVTITLGSTVAWTNQLVQTITVISGQPFRLYLPVIIRQGGTGNAAARVAVAILDDNFSGVISPGDIFTHTFTTLGAHPYFLKERPNFTGQIIVQTSPFDFALSASPVGQTVNQGQSVTYTLNVTGTLGDPQAVALEVGGLPSDVIWSLTPSVTPTRTAMLAVTTTLTTPLNTYTVIITGAAANQVHTTTVTLAVNPHPDFTIAAQLPIASVRQSRSVSTSVSATGLHGFADPVTLTVGDLPAGVSAAWATAIISPGASTTLTLTTALTTPLGDYPLVITGTGGGFTHTTPFTLTVIDHPDFQFSVTPPTQAITQGQITTYTAKVIGLNEWTAPITFSLTGAPTDTVATWRPAALTPNGDSVLSMSIGITTPSGTYSLTAIADGGLISHTAAMTLTALEIPRPDLVVEFIRTQPMTPTVNRPATLTARVKNIGSAPAQPFDVDWYIDPTAPPTTILTGTGAWPVSSLGTGAAVDLSTTVTFTTVTTYTLWAQVNRTQVITERNETNNITGPLTVTVGWPPDLFFSSLSITPTAPMQGQLFTLTVTTHNSGTVDADPFAVDYYLDPTSPPITTTLGDGVWNVDGLAAEAAITLLISRTLAAMGVHSWWAWADRANVLEDGHPDNNRSNQNRFFVDRAPLAPTPFATPTPMPTALPTPITGARQPSMSVPATTLVTNTTWVSGTVYVIVGRVTVTAGVTLTLQPGTVIKFQTQLVKGRLTISGTLLAQGAAAAPIIFTSIHDDAYGGDTNTNGGATWPAAGDWDGLEFTNTSSGSVIDYARVTFGGGHGSNVLVTGAAITLSRSIIRWGSGDGLRWLTGAAGLISGNQIGNNLGSALVLTGSSSPRVSDNTLTNNRLSAVSMHGSCFPNFDNNIVYGNAWNAVGVSGTLGSGTWYPNLAYYATQTLSITAANTLTIQPGTTVKFAANTHLIVSGTLVARGTVTNPIVFTSWKDDQYGGDTQQDGGATKPNQGDWGTLYFADTSNDANTILDQVIVRFGGDGYNGLSYANLTLDNAGPRLSNSFIERSAKYGVQLLNAAAPLIEGNTIWENNDTGLWLSSSAAPTVTGNAFIRNNGYAAYVTGGPPATFDGNIAIGNQTNGIGVTGTITADTTWNANLPFVVEGRVTLTLSATLNLQPDTVVKFTAGGQLIVSGTLQAMGTLDQPIAFTSIKDDTIGGDTNNDGALTSPAAGNWESIRLGATAGASALDYVSVYYGGSLSTTGALVVDSSQPALGHLIVMGSQYRGLFALNTSLLISGSVFAQNGYGLYNGLTATLTVTNSDLFSNTLVGLYNANPGYTLTATANWWGSITGPQHASNLGGTGDVVSGAVTFSPWAVTPRADSRLKSALQTYRPAPTQTQVSGAIAVSTTWTVISSPYVIVGDVTVIAGMTLTIQPGVMVKFAAGKSLNINGLLAAEGLTATHIVFTSIKDDTVGGDSNGDGAASRPAPGDWGQIAFGDTSIDALTKLRYAEVRYGSAIYVDAASPTINDNTINQNSGYGLHVRNNSSPSIQRNVIIDNAAGGLHYESTSAGTLTDNVIWGNTGYAVDMDTSCQPMFANNSAFYNDVNGAHVTTGNVTFSQTWYADLPYVIEGDVTINSGLALTLTPGTVVKFKDTTSSLTVNGALIASGLITTPIVFTSLRDDVYGGDTDNDDGVFWPLPGDWRRITFNGSSDDSRTLLRYTIVRYGGAASNQSVLVDNAAPQILSNTLEFGSDYGLYLKNQANPQIQGNTFTQNGSSGLYLTGSSAPTVTGNIFQRNKAYAVEMTADTKPRFSGNTALDNGTNGVLVGGISSGSTTWDTDLTYVAGAVTIPAGASLTLSPGNVIKFLSTANWAVNGSLFADGTAASRIVLTSLNDDTYGGDTNNDGNVTTPAAGDWGPITIGGSTASASRFRHAIIRYGGDPIKVSQSSLSVTDSVLDFNRRALWYDQSTGTITGTQFLSNTLYGLYETTSGLVIEGNEFKYNQPGGFGSVYVSTAAASHAMMDGNVFVDNYGSAISFDLPSYQYLGKNNSLLYPDMVGNAIRIQGDVNITQNTTLVSNAVYWLDLWTVKSGVTLTISANTIVKFNLNTGLNVGEGPGAAGVLTATGTVTQPVVFTSWKDDSYGGDSNGDGTATTPARGDWGSIFMKNGGVNLDYAVVQYGGGFSNYSALITQYSSYTSNLVYNANIAVNHSVLRYSAKSGISVNGNITAPVSLQNTTVFSNATHGIFVSGGAAGDMTIVNNTFTDNGDYPLDLEDIQNRALSLTANTGISNTYNAIYLKGELGNLSLAPQGTMVYRFDSVSVPTSQTLALQPGTIVKLQNVALAVNGALIATGALSNPVVFTSWQDDISGGDSNGDGMSTAPARGDWDSIVINNGSLNLDYAVVQYGGRVASTFSALITQKNASSGWAYNANIAINHSALRYSAKSGLLVDTGVQSVTVSATVSNSNIYSNTEHGIYNGATISTTVSNSNIYSNTASGLFNANTSYTLTATYNWWGSATGPYHTSNPTGTGDFVSGRVTFSPWLTTTMVMPP